MIFIKNKLLKYFYLGFICSILTVTIIGQDEGTTDIEGKVFGRSLKYLAELQGIPNPQDFFVVVLKPRNVENFPRFIKIRNLYTSKNEKLTEKYFNAEKTWTFQLERDCSCDEKINDWKDTKEILLYKNYDELPQQSFIQCFLLKQKPNLLNDK